MIFTERTITVVNDSATINKPLILYRGDKNIELKITIVESQFKFRSTGASNVIETANASYAQLVINTPYDLPIFSEVTATENGTVIFVISAAMIDEVREVGIYDIQIRLLDDNKQSRVTIPPVSNAIEIREPMAIEDGSAVDSNVVNVAKVNRALTTTSAPLEVFDSQGNYIKNIWGDGVLITDAALNKMEAGIEGVNNKAKNIPTSLSQLTNDANFVNEAFVNDAIAGITGVSTVEPAALDMPKVFFYGNALPTTKDNVNLTMDYISNTAKFSSFVKLKCQGTSSMSYAKKNFTVSMFSDEARATKLKKDFKGWGAQSKFCLKANYVDTTHTRNLSGARIAYDMVNSRPDSPFKQQLLQCPRNGAVDGFPIKLYFNGEFYGIYTWNIPKDGWMFNMDKSNPNHVVLCAERNTDGNASAINSCQFRKLWTDGDGGDWSVEFGTYSTDMVASLNRCINFVMTATDQEFHDNIGEYFDLYSLLDYYCFSYLCCHLDGLAKNMLMATYDGVIWGACLYDMDSIYGVHWNGNSYVATNYQCPEQYQEQFSGLWPRIEKCFATELYARYRELRQGVLSLSNIVKHVEEIYDVIPDRVFADEKAKWTSLPQVNTNTMTRFRNYMRDRAVYVDAQMLEIGTKVPCTGIVLSADTLSFTTTDTQTLSVVVSPDNTTDTVNWSVSPSGIVTVVDGVVTPVSNGECTITVTCGSYNDTCAVTVSGMSESGGDSGGTYTDVGYIESTGTQYINTGIVPTTSTKIELVAEMSASERYDHIFGSDNFMKAQWMDETGTGIYATKKNGQNQITGLTLGKHTYVMDMTDTTNVITIDGTKYGNIIGQVESTTNPLLLLCGYKNDGTIETELCGIGKIYSCKIYHEDTLVANMKPILSNSGTYGLLDTVNNTFYASEVGSFTGPVPPSSGGNTNNYVTDNLYAYYDLTQLSTEATTVEDLSGNNNTFNVVSGTLAKDDLGGLVCNNNNNSPCINSNTFNPQTTEASIEYTFKYTGANNCTTLNNFSNRTCGINGDNGNGYYCWLGGYGYTIFKNHNQIISDIALPSTLVNGEYYHVVCTFSDNEAKIYLNGELLATHTHNVTGIPSNCTYYLGNSTNSGTPAQILYSSRFYNKVLTQDEITQNYTYEFTKLGLISGEDTDIYATAEYAITEPRTFNGTSDYIDTGIKLFDTAKTFTIFVDYATATPTSNRQASIFHCLHEASPFRGLCLMEAVNNDVYFIGGQVSGQNSYADGVHATGKYLISFVDGVINNIVTVDNSGNLVHSATDIGANNPYVQISENLLIGCYQDTSGTKGRYWSGTINKFGVWYKQLTETEINQVFGKNGGDSDENGNYLANASWQVGTLNMSSPTISGSADAGSTQDRYTSVQIPAGRYVLTSTNATWKKYRLSNSEGNVLFYNSGANDANDLIIDTTIRDDAIFTLEVSYYKPNDTIEVPSLITTDRTNITTLTLDGSLSYAISDWPQNPSGENGQVNAEYVFSDIHVVPTCHNLKGYTHNNNISNAFAKGLAKQYRVSLWNNKLYLSFTLDMAETGVTNDIESITNYLSSNPLTFKYVM